MYVVRLKHSQVSVGLIGSEIIISEKAMIGNVTGSDLLFYNDQQISSAFIYGLCSVYFEYYSFVMGDLSFVLFLFVCWVL